MKSNLKSRIKQIMKEYNAIIIVKRKNLLHYIQKGGIV